MAQAGIDLFTIETILGIIVAVGTLLAFFWGGYKYLDDKKERGHTQDSTKIQIISETARFLVPGDIIVSGSENVFEKGREILNNAKKSIKIITITGAAWLLDNRILSAVKKRAKKGTTIQIILIDHQDADITSHIDRMEQLYTSVARPYDRPTSDISSNVKRTLNELENVAEIRLCNKYLFWKGTISDSSQVFYTIYDVPRKDTPMRYNDNEDVANHFEKYVFDMFWDISTPA
ncbi:MAG: hypothetical protein ACFFCP_17105 [Promethearchaeota archaeon]